ncbi:FG-GAP-like repeat-containing protein [Acidobacterium sp. S8]|uniref:FG-GAP-like repeat-containing protein n=1 Tax=Acidobacterium sp. S8 TaxID=1641854 RepID=UPI0020B12C78|nr:FG-GAP-like repeat-containing protein [Acidobacterium sp. S8]
MSLISAIGLHALTPDSQHNSVIAAKLNNTGVALMNQQLMEKALAKFEAAHKADPSSAIPMLNEGIAQLYLRKLPEAEAALKQAAAVDSNNIRIWYTLGLTHFTGDNPTLAIEEFKHAIKLDPDDADSYYYLGTLYLNLKDYDHAIESFETALKLKPLHASAQFGLASALQRSGKVPEAREHLRRFQKITQTKIGTPLTVTYGEQGRYATVQDMLAPLEPVGPMIPVSFVPEGKAAASPTAQPAKDNAPGGGACVLPGETAGEKYIVVMANGENAIRTYKVQQNGSLEEIPGQQTGLTASGHGIACAVGDYDNDGKSDLAVSLSDRVILYHNLGQGKFADVTKTVGIDSLNHPAGLTFVDFDHDGDLDLFVTGSPLESGKGANILWRNNGDSTFTEWTGPTGLGGTTRTTGATLSDINNDRAIDLVVTGDGSAPTVYENQREGAFKAVPLSVDADLSPTRGISIFDFNKDGWMDVAVTHSGAPGVSLWRNVEGKRFERVSLPISGATRAWGVTAIDIDNDGWIDLAAIVDTANGPSLHVWRNLGDKGLEDVSSAVGLDKVNLDNPRSVIAADVDGDGAADLIVTQLNAPPIVLHNQGGNRNHSLRITLAGLADNKSAIGTKVEVFSDGHVQKFEVAGGSGYLSQGSTEIIAGLGQSDTADVVRLLWPTGVPQDELDVAASKPVSLLELDRRGSSCPVLFAWDGIKYQFVSDVIGAAVVGHWVSPTSTNRADPDEWVKVDGSQLKARNGYFSLRFGEPMEEINYIDQLRLIAVDHPAGTEVYPDERFLDEPPFASGSAVVASPQTREVAGAWDNQGRDVLDLLSKRDHKYVRDFTNLKYAGYANMHTLTLDLGEWSSQNPLRLFMHGFIEYFSASSMYAAWQAGLQPISPYIEAQMPDGSWKRIIDDMGFPAGLPRTIVVDLSHKLPVGTRRIRIKTNLQIYWDQVLLDNGPDEATAARQTELHLATAHLAFRGYPQQVDRETPGDLTYHYDHISATGPFQWQRGSYTKYGDVTPLLGGADNHYVIFGSGEEIDAEFSDAKLPPLPAGWKRDYFFYANGFVKDMDFYEAMPFTVAEMPFHQMSKYPYPASERYPEDSGSVRYQLNWNNRFESGDRKQRFQFEYEPTQSQPITK